MDAQRHLAGQLSRQELLKGMAGVAGAGALWTGGSSPQSAARAAQQVRVTVDLSRTTGKTIAPVLYGYATGALLDHDSRLATNAAAQKSAQALAPPLIRFNTPVTTIIQSVFAQGVERPDWTPFANWVQHRGNFLRAGGRLVFGIGPAKDDTSISPATWAQYAQATAQHFRAAGQEITYWEVGNECDPMGAMAYSQYFNAIADALHSVHPAYQVGGPVASWWNGIDLPTFVSQSGSRIGFIDFHSYAVGNKDSLRGAYHKAATFGDVQAARQKLTGTVAASLPIGLLEYNLNGNPQSDGLFGLPAQGTIAGAVYVALLVTQAFTSDDHFTMSALWDLIANSNYGAIGNTGDGGRLRSIDEQGWYLRHAAQLMPGQQVPGTTAATGLQVLATRQDRRFSIQLVNYNLGDELHVSVAARGRAPESKVTRWELSKRFPSGHSGAITSLSRVVLPPQSVVILSGQRA